MQSAIGATPVLIATAAGSGDLTLYNSGNAIVYVDSSSAVTAATGYPINPGATFPWPSGQALWAVCAAGQSSVLLSGPGVAQIHDPLAVAQAQYNTGSRTVNQSAYIGGGEFLAGVTTLDVSSWRSYALSITNNTGLPDPVIVKIQWLDPDGGQLAERTWSLQFSDTLSLQGPCLGSSVRFDVSDINGAFPSGMNYTLSAMLADLAGESNVTNGLIALAHDSISAGATGPVYQIAPYYGPATVIVSGGFTVTCTLTVRFFDLGDKTFHTFNLPVYPVTGTNPRNVFNVGFPGQATRAYITNNDTVARAFDWCITPIAA